MVGVAVELVIGAIGAAVSLGAGLVKTLVHNTKERDEITVTVQRGKDIIEKQGVIRSDKVPTMLDMVDDTRTSSRRASTAP
jgi:hypothetical protein